MKKGKNGGITLIALVITIIVMLILAGVSIATLTGENGVLTQASEAKIKETHATVYEAFLLETQTYKIERETGVVSVPLIEYLQGKGILSADNQINVEKLVGKKLDLGNGTNGVNDIYKLEKVIETGKVATLEKITIADNGTQEEHVKYRIVYYGQQIEEVTEITNIGDVQLSRKEVAFDDADIFVFEDDGKTIVRVNKNYIKEITYEWTDSDGIKKQDEKEILVDGNGDEITKIKVPYGVTKISANAFSGYNNLTIDLPSTVSEIGERAFYYCDVVNVEGKYNQNEFSSLGNSAFDGVTVNYLGYLEAFKYADDEKTILEGIDDNFIIKYDEKKDGDKKQGAYRVFAKDGIQINEITIPDSVVEIREKVFMDFTGLTINIPSSVRTIGDNAFYNCNSVNIEGKTGESDFSSVGENAFQGTNVNYLGNN